MIEPLKIFDNVYFVGQNAVSAFVIKTSAGLIVLDTLNSPEEAKTYIIGGMQKLGLNPKDVKYILISHSHGDHYGGAEYLREVTGAKLVASEIDWGVMTKPPAPAPAAAAGQKPAAPATPPGWKGPKRLPDDISIKTDGEKWTVGDTTLTLLHHASACPRRAVPHLQRLRQRREARRGSLRRARHAPRGRGEEDSHPGTWPLHADHQGGRRGRAPRDSPTQDQAIWKLEELRLRRAGDPNPYVIGDDRYQRYLQLQQACTEYAATQQGQGARSKPSPAGRRVRGESNRAARASGGPGRALFRSVIGSRAGPSRCPARAFGRGEEYRSAMRRINTTKRLLKAGKPAIGTWLNFPCVNSAEVMAHAGWDWVTVDAEHGPMTIEMMNNMFTAIGTTQPCRCAGSRTTIRSGSSGSSMPGRWAIVVPMVCSAEEARQRRELRRSTPRQGIRSAGGGRWRFWAGDDYLYVANDEILVAVMIEHIDAVNRAEEILSVPGVDACFIGPNDLAFSMGLGKTACAREPAHAEAIARVVAAAKNVGVPAGIHAGSVDEIPKRLAQGFQFVACSSELNFMNNAAVQAAKTIREMAGRKE